MQSIENAEAGTTLHLRDSKTPYMHIANANTYTRNTRGNHTHSSVGLPRCLVWHARRSCTRGFEASKALG